MKISIRVMMRFVESLDENRFILKMALDPDLESMTDLECQQQHTNLVIYTISLYLPLAGVHPLLPLHSSCMSKFAGFCWFTMAHLGLPNHTWIWLFSVTKSQ